MDKIELLYDHYKDTYQIIKDTQSDRNRLFIIVCIICSIQFLLIASPESMLNLAVAWIKETYKFDISIQISTVQTGMWLILLYFTMRYYQANTYIERQYTYIHKLENKIATLADLSFDRESSSYLDLYPKVLDEIYIIYTWIFPIVYLIIITTKIVIEVKSFTLNIASIIDLLMFTCCSSLTILYLGLLHKDNIEKWFKKVFKQERRSNC